MSLLASYIAYLGGALAAIGYMGTIQAFEWFSPVLPDLDWALTSLIGTIGPAIGFLIIQSSVQITREKRIRGRSRRKKIKDPAVSWIIVAIISVMLIFFSFGLFGVKPTVIYSGSMQPSMEVGDIAIVSDVPVDSIKEGDIIQYRTETAFVIHRVHRIYEEEGSKLFITKGDANSDPDDTPILPDQITGKVIFNLPKLGWLPIFFRSIFKNIGINI
jgi:signal peptidase